MGEGVVRAALEVVEIAEMARVDPALFTPGERRYASDKSDPERRLAARLAAKRAAASLLGVSPAEIEVLRRPGFPPKLGLSEAAAKSLRALGASRTLVSLTHGATHAAASVLLLRDGE